MAVMDYIKDTYSTIKSALFVLCALLIVGSVIVIAYSFMAHGWEAICDSVLQTIAVGTIIICSVVARVLYDNTPAVSAVVHAVESFVSKGWVNAMDSGIMEYFSPDTKRLEYAGANKISPDAYGMPITTPIIPLTSFNMSIYAKYHAEFLKISEKIKYKELKKNIENNKQYPNIERWMKNFIKLFVARTRIRIIGETCMVVRDWNGDKILIHNSQYKRFMTSIMHHEQSTISKFKRDQYALVLKNKLKGFMWFAQRLRGIGRESEQNPTRYGDIGSEIQTLIEQPELAAIPRDDVTEAVERFIGDVKNPYSFAALDEAKFQLALLAALDSTQVTNGIAPLEDMATDIQTYVSAADSSKCNMMAFYQTALIGNWKYNLKYILNTYRKGGEESDLANIYTLLFDESSGELRKPNVSNFQSYTKNVKHLLPYFSDKNADIIELFNDANNNAGSKEKQ